MKSSIIADLKRSIDLSTCIKRRVTAVIVGDNGVLAWGWNGGEVKPDHCPRMDIPSGEAYHMCEQNCPRQRHAEIDAIETTWGTKDDLRGSVMYIYGHDHICPDCQMECDHYGITTVIVED